MSEEQPFDRAVTAVGIRNTFQKDGRTIKIAMLIRMADWRPLRAPWWRGKEVCVIGADLDGNFFLRHCDGTVRYWQHRTQEDVVVAKSVREFAQHIGESA